MRPMHRVLMSIALLFCLTSYTTATAADASAYRLAYRSALDNEIWTINPDGSDPQQITHDGVDKTGLAASPDGRYLAYYIQSQYDSVVNITHQVVTVLDMATGEQHMITGQEAIADLTWSPDSQQLLFAILTRNPDASTSYEIDVINRDGSERTKIAETFNWMLQPSWSPDGKHILFSRQDADSGYQILIMATNGGHLHEVLHIDACFICDRPRWTPDGQHIIYYRHPDLFIVDTDGQNLRQLTNFIEVYNVSAVFHDRYGSPLYDIMPDSQSLIYMMGYPIQIVKLDLGSDGWAKREVLSTDGMGLYTNSHLSPDGRVMFFDQISTLARFNVETHDMQILSTDASDVVILAAI